MKLTISPTPLKGVAVAETDIYSDDRGSFVRLFCAESLSSIIGDRRIVQINHSRTTKKGAIRGLHFQNPPFAELKMVRCLKGRVFDVAVDLRAGSETYLHWHGESLTPENMKMMVIPEGVAHGFQVLEPDSELLYLHTAPYEKEHERGVLFDDPAIGIDWPIACNDVSERDCEHPAIDHKFTGIKL